MKSVSLAGGLNTGQMWCEAAHMAPLRVGAEQVLEDELWDEVTGFAQMHEKPGLGMCWCRPG